MSRFFIDRPIFATVIAIVIMMAGLLSIGSLAVEQYPNIAPPTIGIGANYPGASAETLEQSVTQVIEQRMQGLDHLMYMSASSTSAGQANVQLTFEAGTDPDIAQVQVQNKLQQAMPSLPQPVQSAGVNVNKSASGFVAVVGVSSTDGSMDRADIGDYISSTLIDPLSRVNGVGSVNVLGSQYAMRIWLDPNKLNQYKLMPSDVATAVRAQNTQVSAGQLGGLPAVVGQQLNATVTALSKLTTAEQFRDIVLIANPDGSVVKLGDVARVELGSDNYDVVSRIAGKPSAGFAISLASGANAVQTADAVKAKIAQLAKFFPPGLEYRLVQDAAVFIRVSIREVEKSLLEAIALVVLIMFLFMQNWRATLIPAITVPVVLLGTFAVLAAANFSINTLTMLALVLAIGLLVDDAIVVVENVERIMQQEGLSPREATIKSMDQITGALLGIAVVLAAVFVPMAFTGGSTGIIYRQFSITIVSAMALSVLVALVLTPALCATLLPRITPGDYHEQRGFFGWFNRTFDRNADRYQGLVGTVVRRSGRMLIIYALLLGAAALLFRHLPTAFLPDEDQGTLMAQVQLPPGATQQRTLAVLDQVEKTIEAQPGVEAVMASAGFNFGSAGQNGGMAFVLLRDWSARQAPELGSLALASRTNRMLSGLRDASVFVLNPSSVRGLGNSSGFDLQIEDVGGLGHDALARARDQLLQLASKDPALTRVRVNGTPEQSQFHVEIDQAKAGALGLKAADINDTLSSALGSLYVNDFINKGRVKKVYIQADAPYRMLPSDLGNWYVRSGTGDMVPVSAFTSSHWTYGPNRLERYNGNSSFEIQGDAAPGHSSGEALGIVERLMAQLPNGIGYEWTGLSYQERLAGSQAPLLYTISIAFVFLCLAALYESWSVPFSVMLAVPVGVVGALSATALRGLTNDVYFQVALLTTIGLASKNAILIVEFARALQEQEKLSAVEAVSRAARIRLRPILMTSYAFMLGVLPLVLTRGAGAAGRIDVGTGVFGSMLTSTLLGIFLVPVLYVVIRGIFDRRQPAAAAEAAPAPIR